MPKLIAIALGLSLLSFTAVAQAQPAPRPDPIAPADGSAATLQGVEARSITSSFNVGAPNTFELPASNPAGASVSLPGLEAIEIKSGSGNIGNPSNIYPLDNSERGGGVQVLYRITQQ